ncbi:MAG: AAA family ATPase [Lachnospiraceae bacterium]|jgi:uridine kinase|nr:AAA family ATPase [Lachnospiraceae bacterium]
MGRTFIVGISGASASGKSTISEHLKQLLENDYKVQLIHMDEYYKEETYRPKIYGISDGVEYIDDNHPMALDLDQCYLDVQKAIEEFDVLIIEGLFSLWDEKIFMLLDLKVFVDCDPDERFARRVLRNLSFGQHLGEITSRYVQAVQPRQKEYVEPTKWKADIILNGFLQTPKGVEIIVNWIYQQLSYNK